VPCELTYWQLTDAHMAALVRAWSRKVKRPVRAYAVQVGPDAFAEAPVATVANQKLLASIFKASAKAKAPKPRG
jgi:hypothetical protein